MARFTLLAIVIFSLFALSIAVVPAPTPCLYNPQINQVLTPLTLPATACSSNTSYCMNVIYKYGNFQYNGAAALKPKLGEIIVFMAKYPDAAQTYHIVILLNANVTTRMNVTCSMTGTAPVNLELMDDPPVAGSTTSDTWTWNSATNNGSFIWVTQPTYTDGTILGPITFLDNYCIKATFSQPNNAIQTLTLMGGTYANPVRLQSLGYQSGATFEYCQYPKTSTVTNDVTCPGMSNGNATASIVTGPSSVNFVWYNSAGNVIATTATATGLAAGNYTVFVNDTSISACSASRTVTINQPTLYPATVSTTPFSCTTKGSASATPVGGRSGFTYQWMNSTGTQTQIGTGSSISNLNVGWYSVKITDSCGSVATTNFYIDTTGCCGDGICQANEACGGASYCDPDCPLCCAPGTYASSATCVACPPGTTSNVSGATSCASCSANTYNAGGNSPCVACPDNSVSAPGSGACTNCACGMVRPSGQASCSACGAGSVPTYNATCTACGAGMYAAAGASACTMCGPGTYPDPATNSGSCKSCPAGTYSAAGSPSCSYCPNGKNSPAGSAHILACN